MPNATFLSRLRRARWVHAVQIFVFISWVMNPFPGALSYWTTGGDGVKTEVGNPTEGDEWYAGDPDNDGLTSLQEVQFGSDPYSIDSDVDGLADSVEYLFSQDALAANEAIPYDPWNWDTNGNGYSDFDEYYQQIQGYTPVVYYPSFQPGSFYSYADADGDGLKNFEDSDPVNMDRDADGSLNWNDWYMDDPYNGAGPPGSPPPEDPGTLDSDDDGTPDQSDPFPYGSFVYGGHRVRRVIQ